MQKPEGLILDFDGVFYQYTPAFHAATDKACVTTAIRMGATHEPEALSAEFKKEKNGLRTFKRLMPHADVFEFHRAYHGIVEFEDTFAREQEAVSVFTDLAHRGVPMVILTQSSYDWVERVNAYLGIGNFLPESHVLGFHQTEGAFKHESTLPVQMAARVLGIAPDRLGMIEDSHANLGPAHELGVHTGFVHYGRPLEPKPVHVRVQAASVSSLVKGLGF